MMNISIKENARIFTCYFPNFEKECNIFHEKKSGTYIRKINEVEIFKLSGFFKKHNLEDLKIENNNFIIEHCVLEDKRERLEYGFVIGSYNPFPQKLVLCDIDKLIVILDKETNWLAILNEEDYERYNVSDFQDAYLKYDLPVGYSF